MIPTPMTPGEELRAAADRLRRRSASPVAQGYANAVARWLDRGAEQADAAPETVSYRLAVARSINSGSLDQPQQEAQ